MEVTVVPGSSDLVHLEIAGRMDTAGVERAETRFYAHFAPREKDTILDLSKVTLLTSMGLRILITSGRTGNARGFRVVLVAPAGSVRDVLDHAAIGELMPVVADVAAARALLGAGETKGR